MSTDAAVPEHILAEVRAICLAFPGASEKQTWGHPTFRVRDKIFAGVGAEDLFDPNAGIEPEIRVTMTMKAAAGEQELLLASGHPFFLPKYVGTKGWIGVVVDGTTDWTEIAELVEESYRAVAPKKLTVELDGRPRPS